MPSIKNESLDDEPIFERMESFGGGVDMFRRSTLLDPDQYQLGNNIIVRDNLEARVRMGADPLSGDKVDAGACLALSFFSTPQYEQLIAAVNDGLWKYESSAWSKLAWAPGVPGSRVAIAQGVDKLLISDGHGNMQVYDGAAFSDCGNDPITSPPVGATIVTWHTGRMFAAGISTAPDTIFVSNRLSFGLGQWNSTTRSFRIGTGDGDPIRAMASIQNFVLCVLKANSIWLVNTDPVNEPADFSTDQDVAALSLGIGCVGRDAWCQYGNDLLFMAQDGVRSVQRMQAAAGQWQLSNPISQPVQAYIDRINRNAWGNIVAKKYQEFAFFFVPLDTSDVNNCCLVWNGRLGRWLGAWTGWNGQAVEITRFGGVNRFVFGDDAGYVNQWKDYTSLTEDSTYQDNGVGYPAQLWTRSMLFGDPICDKSAYNTSIRFSAGNSSINVYWVADNAVKKDWQAQPEPTGDILGVDVLPFLLASPSTITVKKGIRGLPAFNEAYLRVESESGWWVLRNITAGAFVNPLKEQ